MRGWIISVDDHGLESIRKSANEKIPGSKADYYLSFAEFGGTKINPLSKYVEATYTNDDKTVTYRYYESSSKVTLYNTITTVYSVAQDTSFTSAEWS